VYFCNSMKQEQYIARILPVLKEDGLGLPIEIIAERIGVTKKTLYNQFDSKDELIAQCLDNLFNQFKESVSPLGDERIDVCEGLEKGIIGLSKYFADISHPFMLDLDKNYPSKAKAGHVNGCSYFEGLLKNNIERGIKAKVYREDIDSALFSRYIAFSIFSFFQKEIMRGNKYSANYYFTKVIDFNKHALLK